MTKKLNLKKIAKQLRICLNEGNMTVQMQADEGEITPLSEEEYQEYLRVLGEWTLQVEEMEK
jgi:hypothetical protein